MGGKDEEDLLAPIMRWDCCPPCSQLQDQALVTAIVMLKMVMPKAGTAKSLDLACFLSVYNVLDIINSLQCTL